MKEYKYTINGQEYKVTLGEIEGNIANVVVNGQSDKVDMEKKAEEPKPVVRPVVKPAAPAAKPAAQPAAQPAPAAGGSGRGVKSPLPGVILDVKVKVGDAVKKGQTVVILEAMKMENNINADQDGTITAINVKQGDSVLEGTDLVMIG